MQRFEVDEAASEVRIHARSSLHPIDGEAKGLSGFVAVALSDGKPDLSTRPEARIELPVDRLESGNRLYDAEMQRRIEARRYPVITGELESAEEVGEGRYRVTGRLGFHGREHTVEAEVRLDVDSDRLVAEWSQTIDIRDFDVTPPKILMLKVHPEVEVEVRLEGMRR